MEAEKIPRSVGVHDGTFHADEVTACALLIFFNLVDKNQVFRSRDPLVLSKCEYVCDVGGIYDPEKKLFDHHQIDYKGDKSSAGMIADYLKAQGILDKESYDMFLDKLIIGVDDHDNGRAEVKKGYAYFSHIISNFTPIRHDCPPEAQDRAFTRALDFVVGHLDRLWQRYNYYLECQQIVKEAMIRDKEVLYFDSNIPWIESFFKLDGDHHPAKFVLMPSGEHWKLRGIPPNYQKRMDVRIPFPKEWAGLLDEDLKKKTGIPGAIFCHKGRFITVWETKQDAEKALKKLMK